MCHLCWRIGQGCHLDFPVSPKNTNLVRGRWILVSCKVSLNFIQRFQKRSGKCFSQSHTRAAILVSIISPITTNVVENNEIWHPVRFRWLSFSCFRGEVENVSANQMPPGHLGFRIPIGLKNTNLTEDVEILPLSVQFSRKCPLLIAWTEWTLYKSYLSFNANL